MTRDSKNRNPAAWTKFSFLGEIFFPFLIISISSKKNETGSQIHFVDNGTGFDMEKSENRLFELHQKFTDHKDSKGIGLYLVKSYMNSLGGDIDVNSKTGVGTSFILSFKDWRITQNFL